MKSNELFSLLKQVVVSWQVIFITIAFILFWTIVNNAVNPKPKKIKVTKQQKIKRPKQETSKELADDVDTGELGLD
jgi:F0F1-type ATP synthase membrane subunit b/b'